MLVVKESGSVLHEPAEPDTRKSKPNQTKMADHVKKTSVPSGLEALLKEYPALRVDDSKGKVGIFLQSGF